MPAPETDPFSPAQWRAYFAALDPDVRSRCAAEICGAVLSQTELHSSVLDQALSAIGEGHAQREFVEAIEELLLEIEDRYEARGGCDAPVDDVVAQTEFVQARAASAVLFALQEEWVDMAYEAVHAVPADQDPLDQLRRITG
jgi:hypothetical protein